MKKANIDEYLQIHLVRVSYCMHIVCNFIAVSTVALVIPIKWYLIVDYTMLLQRD